MRTYIVKPGDTLSGIAQKNRCKSWRDIYFHPANLEFQTRRPDPNRIFPGDVIGLPDWSPDAIRLNVPQLYQTKDADCWFAAARMIFAYRRMSVAPLYSLYQKDSGLSPTAVADLAKATGLVGLPPHPGAYFVQELESILKRYGPLWVPLEGKGAHVMVLTGADSPGRIYMNDPGIGFSQNATFDKARDIAWFNQYVSRSIPIMYLP